VQILHNFYLFTEQQHIKPPNVISMQIERFVMLYDNSCSYLCLLPMCHKLGTHHVFTWRMNATLFPITFQWSSYRWRHKLRVDWYFLQCMGTHISIKSNITCLKPDLCKVILTKFFIGKKKVFRWKKKWSSSHLVRSKA